MDLLKQLNEAIDYIEKHLCEELDPEKLSRITLYSAETFDRFFSYMTGMTLHEYIRRRRLTRAAYELRNPACRIIDIAMKYGYKNPDSFTRAF